ncbi:MAG TPA: hypothetical protein ENH94_04255 [Phycisphaerales bacterium]|nr:hypothetical protein [Phycisphaerales bacterium]
MIKIKRVIILAMIVVVTGVALSVPQGLTVPTIQNPISIASEWVTNDPNDGGYVWYVQRVDKDGMYAANRPTFPLYFKTKWVFGDFKQLVYKLRVALTVAWAKNKSLEDIEKATK